MDSQQGSQTRQKGEEKRQGERNVVHLSETADTQIKFNWADSEMRDQILKVYSIYFEEIDNVNIGTKRCFLFKL